MNLSRMYILSRTYIGSFMVARRPRTGLIVALNAIVEREMMAANGWSVFAFILFMEIAKSCTLPRIRIDSTFSLPLSFYFPCRFSRSIRNPDPWIASERKSGRGPLLSTQGCIGCVWSSGSCRTVPQQGIPGLRATSRTCTCVCVHKRLRIQELEEEWL